MKDIQEVCSISFPAPTDRAVPAVPLRLCPIRAELSRLERITVCTRPFRAEGPRIEAERFGDKLLVHNYGHGGSGWSLSWGSAALVVPLVLTEGVKDVAVIGCGALGITSAIALQRSGAHVTIYARDLPPDVRSSRATGSWTPDARVALRRSSNQGFGARWEQMARVSFMEYESLLGLPGEPVKVQPRYLLFDRPPEAALAERYSKDPIGFVHIEDRLADLMEAPLDLPPGDHPFAGMYCRRTNLFRFDLSAYSRHVMAEFRVRGGTVHRTEFHAPSELLALKQRVLVHCTGYGARALFSDESVIPIRGQINWLPSQPEVDYSLQWENLNAISRPDGMVVQLGGGGDPAGWNDPGEVPDPSEAQDAIRKLADLQAHRLTPDGS